MLKKDSCGVQTMIHEVALLLWAQSVCAKWLQCFELGSMQGCACIVAKFGVLFLCSVAASDMPGAWPYHLQVICSWAQCCQGILEKRMCVCVVTMDGVLGQKRELYLYRSQSIAMLVEISFCSHRDLTLGHLSSPFAQDHKPRTKNLEWSCCKKSLFWLGGGGVFVHFLANILLALGNAKGERSIKNYEKNSQATSRTQCGVRLSIAIQTHLRKELTFKSHRPKATAGFHHGYHHIHSMLHLLWQVAMKWRRSQFELCRDRLVKFKGKLCNNQVAMLPQKYSGLAKRPSQHSCNWWLARKSRHQNC